MRQGYMMYKRALMGDGQTVAASVKQTQQQPTQPQKKPQAKPVAAAPKTAPFAPPADATRTPKVQPPKAQPTPVQPVQQPKVQQKQPAVSGRDQYVTNGIKQLTQNGLYTEEDARKHLQEGYDKYYDKEGNISLQNLMTKRRTHSLTAQEEERLNELIDEQAWNRINKGLEQDATSGPNASKNKANANAKQYTGRKATLGDNLKGALKDTFTFSKSTDGVDVETEDEEAVRLGNMDRINLSKRIDRRVKELQGSYKGLDITRANIDRGLMTEQQAKADSSKFTDADWMKIAAEDNTGLFSKGITPEAKAEYAKRQQQFLQEYGAMDSGDRVYGDNINNNPTQDTNLKGDYAYFAARVNGQVDEQTLAAQRKFVDRRNGIRKKNIANAAAERYDLMVSRGMKPTMSRDQYINGFLEKNKMHWDTETQFNAFKQGTEQADQVWNQAGNTKNKQTGLYTVTQGTSEALKRSRRGMSDQTGFRDFTNAGRYYRFNKLNGTYDQRLEGVVAGDGKTYYRARPTAEAVSDANGDGLGSEEIKFYGIGPSLGTVDHGVSGARHFTKNLYNVVRLPGMPEITEDADIPQQRIEGTNLWTMDPRSGKYIKTDKGYSMSHYENEQMANDTALFGNWSKTDPATQGVRRVLGRNGYGDMAKWDAAGTAVGLATLRSGRRAYRSAEAKGRIGQFGRQFNRKVVGPSVRFYRDLQGARAFGQFLDAYTDDDHDEGGVDNSLLYDNQQRAKAEKYNKRQRLKDNGSEEYTDVQDLGMMAGQIGHKLSTSDGALRTQEILTGSTNIQDIQSTPHFVQQHQKAQQAYSAYAEKAGDKASTRGFMAHTLGLSEAQFAGKEPINRDPITGEPVYISSEQKATALQQAILNDLDVTDDDYKGLNLQDCQKIMNTHARMFHEEYNEKNKGYSYNPWNISNSSDLYAEMAAKDPKRFNAVKTTLAATVACASDNPKMLDDMLYGIDPKGTMITPDQRKLIKDMKIGTDAKRKILIDAMKSVTPEQATKAYKDLKVDKKGTTDAIDKEAVGKDAKSAIGDYAIKHPSTWPAIIEYYMKQGSKFFSEHPMMCMGGIMLSVLGVIMMGNLLGGGGGGRQQQPQVMYAQPPQQPQETNYNWLGY